MKSLLAASGIALVFIYVIGALALTAILTLPMVVIAFRTSIPIGLALLPYQAWVAIAANLSYTYSKLN
jgi:tryptophan-rich sensory protein